MFLDKMKFSYIGLTNNFCLKFFKIVFFSLLINACSNTDNLIKMSEVPPDEFAVVRKDPLEIPPNFNLRPPGKSKKNNSLSSSDRAKDVLSDLISSKKKNTPTNQELTIGDSILLKKTGFAESKSNIREILITENSEILQNKGRIEILVERLVGSDSDKNILDPVTESKRNQEKIATGENFLKSQKPIIIRRVK